MRRLILKLIRRRRLERDLDAELDHALVLVVAERGRLPGGADRHQPVRALGDLPGDEVLVRLLVDRAVPAHRRDQRDERSLEHGVHLPAGGGAASSAN